MKFIFICLLIYFSFFFSSCKNNNSEFPIIDLEGSIAVRNFNKMDWDKISKNVESIQLETSDSCLLVSPRIIDVTKSIIVVEDRSIIYIFNAKNGRLEQKIDRKGGGPEEYSSIMDVVVDSNESSLYINDSDKGKIIIYSFKGEFIKSLDINFVGSFNHTANNDFVVSFNPVRNNKNLVGFYDKTWRNIINLFDSKNEKGVLNKGFVFFNPIKTIGDKTYFKDEFSDTLYAIKNHIATPILTISKGKYKIAKTIAADFSKRQERKKYIFGEYGQIVNNYYFLAYYFQNEIISDIWDIKTSKLLYRNIAKNKFEYGFPLNLKSKEIYVWPNYVDEEFIYFFLKNNNFEERNEDLNPIIAKIRKDVFF
ncbi:hypothetical protein Palpr_1559 [Paludibacter propionicigenes WB4]|uniref:6-bladed beta-propeller n=1 Tax=Paludibacter propionicigenes (strain DSM 17365 / JCM 13257 / WB4) TaxID=694427 RepID=E4T4R0_PALPW|nr:6-bladed beta-propeller [Paludibacter propionicigenes]ADQ79704.1 hypothetical protein Palpr_1559 [Paludibacter propionicigenes WB4]